MATASHHVKINSHAPEHVVAFLRDVVGMSVVYEFDGPSSMFETAFGWPPSEGAHVWLLGSGDTGLVEVTGVPTSIRHAVPEGLAGIAFDVGDVSRAVAAASEFADGAARTIDLGSPGIDLALVDVRGVTVELLGLGAAAASDS